MKNFLLPLVPSLACAAQAATITVDSADDSLTATSSGGACTLRGAVEAIRNGTDPPGGCTNSAPDDWGVNDTILFALALAGTTIDVKATPGEIVIDRDLVIRAPAGGITLDAGNSNRILNVTGGARLGITGVTFINGNAGNTLLDYGGAIYVDPTDHTLTLEQCTFLNNKATNSLGGAVATSDAIIIRNSTFSDNTSRFHGGAVYADSDAIISNSTFRNNSVTNSGNHGGAVYADSLDARHLTLLNNTASGFGQALYVGNSSGSGNATLHNSIIIGNSRTIQCVQSEGDFTGSHNLEGHATSGTSGIWQGPLYENCGSSNPVSGGTAGITPLSAIIAVDLADNGGPTPTLALPAGSPAIGAADTTISGGTSQMWSFNAKGWTDATLDQRGYGRLPVTTNDGRSIGAYEYGALDAIITPKRLSEATAGDPYTQQMYVQSTSSGLTFSSANLPAGLSINGAGAITGTPQAADTYKVTITVSDTEGRQVSRLSILPVQSRALPLSNSDTPIPALSALLLLVLAALVGATTILRQRRR